MKKIFAFILLIAYPVLVVGQTKWQATAGSISFTIKNRGSNVSGRFTGFNTTLVFSPDKLASSSLKGFVDVNTINTGINKRDKDLKGETYFDLGKHKMIEVSSTKLAKQGTQFTGSFNVTIKGVTKTVEIPFQFIQNGNTAEFTGSFTVNRRDFGVGNKKGLAFFLSDDAHVSILIKAKK